MKLIFLLRDGPLELIERVVKFLLLVGAEVLGQISVNSLYVWLISPNW